MSVLGSSLPEGYVGKVPMNKDEYLMHNPTMRKEVLPRGIRPNKTVIRTPPCVGERLTRMWGRWLGWVGRKIRKPFLIDNGADLV